MRKFSSEFFPLPLFSMSLWPISARERSHPRTGRLARLDQAQNISCQTYSTNIQMDFCRTSGKRSGLFPVRLGHAAQLPAFGSRFASWASNGAFDISRRISLAIHSRRDRIVTASAFLSFKTAAVVRCCGKHSASARRWSSGCSRAISKACATVSLPR